MSKKLPSKTKVKGMVGKPAEPTVAPGGSVAGRGLGAPARRRGRSTGVGVERRCR